LSYSDVTRNEMVIMNDLEQLSFTFKLIKYGYFIIRTIQIRVDTVNILKGNHWLAHQNN